MGSARWPPEFGLLTCVGSSPLHLSGCMLSVWPHIHTSSLQRVCFEPPWHHGRYCSYCCSCSVSLVKVVVNLLVFMTSHLGFCAFALQLGMTCASGPVEPDICYFVSMYVQRLALALAAHHVHKCYSTSGQADISTRGLHRSLRVGCVGCP